MRVQVLVLSIVTVTVPVSVETVPPEALTMLPFFSVMTALVLVTWKTWPFLRVRLASSYTVKFT